MPYLSSTDVPLYYETHGRGPDLVFIHGSKNNHLQWWQQIPTFRKHYRCTLYDLRGHGLSYPKGDGFNPNAHPDDLRALLDGLKITRATLICHSLGTHVGLSFALQHPDRVDSLVLVSGHGGAGAGAGAAYWAAFEQQHHRPPDWANCFAPAFREREPEMAFLSSEIFKMNRPLPENFTRDSGHVDPELFLRLPRFTRPTLFISGADDEPMAPQAVEPAQKLFPNSRLAVIPGAGHYVFFEKAREFNALVLDFLRAVHRPPS